MNADGRSCPSAFICVLDFCWKCRNEDKTDDLATIASARCDGLCDGWYRRCTITAATLRRAAQLPPGREQRHVVHTGRLTQQRRAGPGAAGTPTRRLA